MCISPRGNGEVVAGKWEQSKSLDQIWESFIRLATSDLVVLGTIGYCRVLSRYWDQISRVLFVTFQYFWNCDQIWESVLLGKQAGLLCRLQVANICLLLSPPPSLDLHTANGQGLCVLNSTLTLGSKQFVQSPLVCCLVALFVARWYTFALLVQYQPYISWYCTLHTHVREALNKLAK